MTPLLRQAMGFLLGGLVGAAVTRAVRRHQVTQPAGQFPTEANFRTKLPEPERPVTAGAKSPLTRRLSRAKGKIGRSNLSVSPSGVSSRGFAASVPRRVSHAYRSPKQTETRTSTHRAILRRKLKQSNLSNRERKLLARQLKLG